MVPGFEPDRYASVEEFLKYFGYEVTTRLDTAEREDSKVPSTKDDYSSSRRIYRSPW
jgi:hypothetical protein